MLDMILHEVEALPLKEKRELAGRISALIAEELEGSALDGAPTSCPRCGSSDFIRKGRGRGGRQRWRCKACGRTFSRKTGSVIAMSKLDAGTWAAFAQETLAGSSLRECARACHVCLRTSWFMRMRLFEVMGRALVPFRHGPQISCQADSTYLDESLTGNRARSARKMPRRARRNGTSGHGRGISAGKVCVECAANDLGDAWAHVCGRGRPKDSEVREALSGIVDGSWVSTDGHAAYERVLPQLKVTEHIPTESKRATRGELGLVNALHQKLHVFLEPFHGVSTKWLGRYLWCFLWLEQARRSDADRRGMLSGQLTCGRYSRTRRDLIDMPQPLWNYWEQRTSTLV